MTMQCKICNDPNRLAIDRCIINNGNLSKIAREFNVSYDSLFNHSKNHLTRQLAKAWTKKQELNDLSLLNEIEELITDTRRITRKAEDDGQLNTAINAINSARGCYELLSKIAFSLHQAKLDDQEQQRTQDRTDFSESLKCLSTDELHLLIALQDKIKANDPDITIVTPVSTTTTPEPEVTDPAPEPTTTAPTEPERDLSPSDEDDPILLPPIPKPKRLDDEPERPTFTSIMRRHDRMRND